MRRAPIYVLLIILAGLVSPLPLFAQSEPPVSTWFFIKSVQSGTEDAGYWDQPGTPKKYERGANLMVYAKDTSFNKDQQFKFVSAGNGWFYIVSRNGGYVDVAGGGTKNGTNVCIRDGNNQNNQKYRFQYLGNGRWKIFPQTGGMICLESKSHQDRSNIHIWENQEGAFAEWYLIDASTGKIATVNDSVEIPGKAIRGQLVAMNYDDNMRASRIDPGITDVEVWLYDYKDDNNHYKKAEAIKTDNLGRFALPSKYMAEGSVMLMAHRDNRSTAVSVIYPTSNKLSMGDFVMERYSSPDYVLVQTPYRGKRWYRYQDGNYYLVGGKISQDDNFFFPESGKKSKAVTDFLAAAFPGLPLGQARNDQEIIDKFNTVFLFTSTKTKSIMGGQDQLAAEASNYLFRNCRKTPESSLNRWPGIEEYAETFNKYGFIPTGNCTAWSQLTATLLYTVGVPPNRFCVTKFHYDMSWIVEHWIIGLYMNGRWYNMEPQHSDYIKLKSPETFKDPYWEKYVLADFDYKEPFEIWLLPGSTLNQVPWMGAPSELAAIQSEKIKPRFFADNPSLKYETSGLTFSGKGTAKVVKIEGNKAIVEITAVINQEGPKGWEDKKVQQTIEITMTGGIYTYAPSPDYQYTGSLQEDGKSLYLSGEQSGMRFFIP